MSVPDLLLLFGLSMSLASAALADGLCNKQRSFGVPVLDTDRACRLNAVFDSWLAEHDFQPDTEISVSQYVGAIDSSQTASRMFLLPEANRPWAQVDLSYYLGKNQSLAASEAVRFRPGLFLGLESALKAQAKTIVCETIREDEQAFVSAGGAVLYQVGLRPRFRDSRTPDWFVKIEISQSSCEVN